MADEKKAMKTEDVKATKKAADNKASKKSDAKKSDGKKSDSKKSDKKKSGKSPLKSIGSFFKGVRNEGKKVVWPKPLEVVKNTIVVLVVILILGLIIFGIDQGLAAIFKGTRKLADERTTVTETTTMTPDGALADLIGGDDAAESGDDVVENLEGAIEGGNEAASADSGEEATAEADAN